jgi:hypothetical protein
VPVLHAARRNAFRIFNTDHSAMRQWGSSNGLSFFLTTIPEGNLFYHGSISPGLPDRFEWLAFEIEHASAFGQSVDSSSDDRDDSPDFWTSQLSNSETREAPTFHMDLSQVAVSSNNQDRPDLNSGEDKAKLKPPLYLPPPPSRGYFQTYRGERPLKLVYIDGMAAPKTMHGTLDS